MRFLLFLGLIGSTSCDSFNDFYKRNEGATIKDILRTRRSALADPEFRWPNETVPYQMDDIFTKSEKQKIHEAMEEIQNKTCVTFRNATESDHDRIRIVKRDGCYSFLGRLGNTQDLSIGEGCLNSRDILRQLMHTLGFINEQTRPDRDEYVDIIWDNIQENYKFNFAKRQLEHPTLMDTPYSYDSIMHYRSDAFAKVEGQPTIIAKKPTNNMGGGDHLSDIDVTRILKLYCS